MRSTAIPSVFNFPTQLQLVIKAPRRKLLKHLPKKKRALCAKVLSNHDNHDHSYHQTPKQELCLKQKVSILQKKLKNTRAKLKTRSGQNKRLKDIITNLKNQHLIDTQAKALLQDSFSGMSIDLFRHIRRDIKNKKPYYLPKVKNFVLSLHFLSPKVYNFVRPILHLSHPPCLHRSKAPIHCSPEYLNNKLKVASAPASATKSYHCSLNVDEMSLIKKRHHMGPKPETILWLY